MVPPINKQSKDNQESKDDEIVELKREIDRLNRDLETSLKECKQSGAYGLTLLNEKEDWKQRYEELETLSKQDKEELEQLKAAWDRVVSQQKESATTVYEKEVQLLNDSDALAASFSLVKQEIEKDLKHKVALLETTSAERDKYLDQNSELSKRIEFLENDRKSLKAELKDLRNRESKLFSENNDLEEENVSLQKQVSALRSSIVDFEASKHEVKHLEDQVRILKQQFDEVNSLKEMFDRQKNEAFEALQSEREQKYALRKELDNRNSTEQIINYTSIAALKGSPHLANLALNGARSSSFRLEGDDMSSRYHESGNEFGEDYSYEASHEFDMPSIEGSLFDELHLSEMKKLHLGEIKKLQTNLEDRENQRSILNTKLIESQHKLDSKARLCQIYEQKLKLITSLIQETHDKLETNKNKPSIDDVGTIEKPSNDTYVKLPPSDKPSYGEDTTSSTSSQTAQMSSDPSAATSVAINITSQASILDEFDKIYDYLKALLTDFKSQKEMSDIVINSKKNEAKIQQVEKNMAQMFELINVQENNDPSDIQASLSSVAASSQSSTTKQAGSTNISGNNTSNEVQNLRTMLYKKKEENKSLRNIVITNKNCAEVALANLKSKYEIEQALNKETMTKMRHDMKALKEDAATFASSRLQYAALIAEYKSENDKLRSKISATEQEKNTLNSILRMAIEQKVQLTQQLEAIEMEREGSQLSSANTSSRDGQQTTPGSFSSRLSGGAGGRRGGSSYYSRNSGNSKPVKQPPKHTAANPDRR